MFQTFIVQYMEESFPKEKRQLSIVNRVLPLRLFGQITVYKPQDNIHLQSPQVIKIAWLLMRQVQCKKNAMERRNVPLKYEVVNFQNRIRIAEIRFY